MAKTVKRAPVKKSDTDDWKFSISEALSYGWAKAEFFGITIGISVLIWIVRFVLDWAGREIGGAAALLIWLLSMYVSIMVSLGWTRTTLNVLSGKAPALAYFCDMDNHQYFWSYLGACLLSGLIVLAGLILFVIPGIVWSFTYALAPILVVDKKLSPTKALAMSRKLVAGQRLKLFVFYLVLCGVNILGLLCLGVGLLVTIPLSYYASIYVYGKLVGKSIK